jgi:hypothetical protein
MKELCTEIEIQSTPEKIWQILTNLDQYPEWNPLIYRAIGTVKVGEKVQITVKSGSKETILHCTVVKAEPGKELRWKYHVVLPGLFRGEHRFVIQPIGNNKIRFVDREIFDGLFVPLQSRSIDTNSRRGFEAMDQALKMRAERN